MTLPRIALVTPVFNSAKYIEQTIRSVLAQNYPNLEYFIIDGGSTDGTLDIIRKYESQISGWLSEPDKGMYDAINKGFARTSSEIMGWISATDQLQIGGLSVVSTVFQTFREVEWITGRPTIFNEGGIIVHVSDLPRWSRFRFMAGANHAIQQESTYWRRTLWEKAGGSVDSSRRNGSDFELWVRFFQHARLYSVDALIGGFRLHDDSLFMSDIQRYKQTSEEILDHALNSTPGQESLKLIRRMGRAAKSVPKLRGLWQRVVINSLYRIPGPDWPPVIRYRADKGWFLDK